MIIGIDDSGLFTPTEEKYNFFVSVLLNQNNQHMEIKENQYKKWELTIPENRKVKGEVKGQNLLDENLETFCDQVLFSNPIIYYTVVQIKPQQNPESVVFKHHNHEIDQIAAIIKQATELNRPKAAKRYNQLRVWMKNLNYYKVLKLKCLETSVAMSFHEALELAQRFYLTEKDESNFNIQIKIDKDFINGPEPRGFYNETFRQFWRVYTLENKLTIVKPEGNFVNPITKYFDLTDTQLGTRDTFSKKTNFVDSKDHFEIRIADVTSFILHRYINRHQCINIGRAVMAPLSFNKSRYTQIILEPDFKDK